MYTIANDQIKVQLNELGATLTSVLDREGHEYLWQGNPKYWTEQAPNLFPYIGRLTNGQYYLNGQTYCMGIHGFARNMVFNACQQSESTVLFSLKHSEETHQVYPFMFEFCVHYEVVGNEIRITYMVHNEGNETMFFAVGGHPGFRVPFVEETDFEDYYLEFCHECKPIRICFSENYMLTDERRSFLLVDGCRLPLKHSLFDEDAIVLQDMAKKVRLCCTKHDKYVEVSYPEMPYLGIWHRPLTDAPYVCIEPWSSLPSREGIIEDLSKQPDLIALLPSEKYTSHITIALGSL